MEIPPIETGDPYLLGYRSNPVTDAAASAAANASRAMSDLSTVRMSATSTPAYLQQWATQAAQMIEMSVSRTAQVNDRAEKWVDRFGDFVSEFGVSARDGVKVAIVPGPADDFGALASGGRG